MKRHCLVTTYYSNGGISPTAEQVKIKFNSDVSGDDIFVNFSNTISPHKTDLIPNIGCSRRKDLVFCKIFMLNSFIKRNIVGKYEYVCHIDYSDTKFCRSYNEMMETIISSNKEIIISTEKQCWPYIDTVSTWKTPRPSLENKEFKYLNSGALFAKTEVLIKILKDLENICLTSDIDFWDDQGAWQYYDLFISSIEKDHRSEYFFSTGLLDESYYIKEDGKITTKFGTKPFLIHDNSSFSLNLTHKI